ncbi:multiple epidermal growth factor-like domains 10 [Elysia marginata]|uniref:Multiple epidermal growth factor-like domains 10 n=1 Tax=Elysia marginata TaxID=1093978 RepID=A0AAV4FZP0_9GAST|nr:multiple epidermal growth factor-like domains 10 [Elysia marginata]
MPTRKCKQGCSKNCKEPSEGSNKCNPHTGMCTSGCKSGFSGPSCEDECLPRKFGEACSHTCNKNCDKDCHKQTGACRYGCNAGYRGSFCNTSCVDTYGKNCARNCSENCRSTLAGSRCDGKTGACTLGCNPGYQTLLCEEACSDGTYGENCERACSAHCHNASEADRRCNPVYGSCNHGCVSGYIGIRCDRKDPQFLKDNKESVLGEIGKTVIIYGTNTMMVIVIGVGIFLLIVTPMDDEDEIDGCAEMEILEYEIDGETPELRTVCGNPHDLRVGRRCGASHDFNSSFVYHVTDSSRQEPQAEIIDIDVVARGFVESFLSNFTNTESDTIT